MKDTFVLISGASSGIGLATAWRYAEHGYPLILLARRFERLKQLAAELHSKQGVAVHPFQVDVCQRQQIEAFCTTQADLLKRVEILINNAGLALGRETFDNIDLDDCQTMINTNVTGLVYLTRALLPHLLKRQSAHIVNIGSIAGRQNYRAGNVYCATKAAVRSLTECLRLDLAGSQVRVTAIDPGMVETEFSLVRFHGDQARAEKVYADTVPLKATDIADAIFYATSRPQHVNIQEILIMPTAQASVTQLIRKPTQ
jgi:serine 3-dehydrogenase